jgi:hypothetical protein
MKNDNSTSKVSSLRTFVRLWIGRLFLPAILCVAIAALAARAVPGRGSVAGDVTVTPAGPGQVDLEVNAEGIITLLGKSTLNLRLRADVSGPIPTPIPPSTGVVTAANGDTVIFTLRWTLEEVAPGVFVPSGPFTVSGGTGRFSGATGGGDYHGLVDMNSGEATAEFTGQLAR